MHAKVHSRTRVRGPGTACLMIGLQSEPRGSKAAGWRDVAIPSHTDRAHLTLVELRMLHLAAVSLEEMDSFTLTGGTQAWGRSMSNPRSGARRGAFLSTRHPGSRQALHMRLQSAGPDHPRASGAGPRTTEFLESRSSASPRQPSARLGSPYARQEVLEACTGSFGALNTDEASAGHRKGSNRQDCLQIPGRFPQKIHRPRFSAQWRRCPPSVASIPAPTSDPCSI